MNIINSILTKNPCYVAGRKITVKGLMLHSIGCPQPDATVFVKNWNNTNYDSACVHGFIDANNGNIYQTLPWDHRGWHGGGASNNTHIGVEMCEPACIKYTGGASFTCSDVTTAQACVKTTYNSAVELFAYLCKMYNLDPLKDIISHSEGYKKGIASNHGDPEHLWSQLKTGYTMDTFRQAVKTAMGDNITTKETVKKSVDELAKEVIDGKWGNGNERETRLTQAGYNYSDVQNKVNELLLGKSTKDNSFTVQVSITNLNIRRGPSHKQYTSVGFCPKGVYTIVETKTADGYTWGKLKSGAGWIALEYTNRL